MEFPDFLLYLHEFLDMIWALMNKNLISFNGWNLSFISIFSFCFIAWALREIVGVLLDRHPGEV